jgi:hypothetical protein
MSMSNTANLALPLLEPSQAQKHVTVNEALVRLDALASLVLASRVLPAPPIVAAEGAVYAVPSAPAGDWSGQAGRIAIRANGGWTFAAPRRGQQAWIADESALAIHDGDGWRVGAVALAPSGAASFLRILDFEHSVEPGATSLTSVEIPANVMVLAVAARVRMALTGTLASWRLGTPGADDRFGSGMGVAVGSYGHGLLSSPMAFYAPEPLLISAEGGVFAGGSVRLAVHYFEPGLPDG